MFSGTCNRGRSTRGEDGCSVGPAIGGGLQEVRVAFSAIGGDLQEVRVAFSGTCNRGRGATKVSGTILYKTALHLASSIFDFI